MSNRSAPNLLGRSEDKRAYAPPEAVHGANSEAAVVPSSSRHDNLSPVRKSCGQRRHCPYHPNLVIATLDCWRVSRTTGIPHQPSHKLRVPGSAKTSTYGKIFQGFGAAVLTLIRFKPSSFRIRINHLELVRAKCLVDQADNGQCGNKVGSIRSSDAPGWTRFRTGHSLCHVQYQCAIAFFWSGQ